jgi:hypothetical protein
MIQGFSGGLLNRELIYQTDLPSFQRDFASLKTLDHGTGPSITFTRASDATYFDADGVLQTAANDTPRFDHDPATGASRGLLIEEARTNLLERSAEFDNAYWSKTSGGTGSAPVVTADVGVAPDGTTTADQIDFDRGVGNTTSDFSVIRRSLAVPATGDYTQSVWLKAATSGDIGKQIAIRNVNNGFYTIITLTADWVRYTRTENTSLTASRPFEISNRGTFTADNTVSVLAWGAQLEAGAFPTSYIPTTTAAATRSADSAVVTPISSFYNQAEGTLFAEWAAGGQTDAIVVSEFNDGSTTNRIGIITTSSSLPSAIGRPSAGGWDINVGSAISLGVAVKMAMAFAVDNVQAARDGTLGTADTSATMPSVSQLRLGRSAGGGTQANINGHIRKIAYWPKRLTNTLLEQLTT